MARGVSFLAAALTLHVGSVQGLAAYRVSAFLVIRMDDEDRSEKLSRGSHNSITVQAAMSATQFSSRGVGSSEQR